MTKKNKDKLTVSLTKDDEAKLVKIRTELETVTGMRLSFADVVRYCIAGRLA
jgi:hypothetical protein